MTISSSGLISLYLQTIDTSSSVIPLFISPGVKPTGNLNLIIKSPGLSCSWPEQLYNTWPQITWTQWKDWCGLSSSGIIRTTQNCTSGYFGHEAYNTNEGYNTNWTDLSSGLRSDGKFTTAIIPSGDYVNAFYSTKFQFNVPQDASISGISVEIAAFDPSGETVEVGARLNEINSGPIGSIRNYTPLILSTESGASSIRTYGGPTDYWGNSSGDLTPSLINSSGFGADIHFHAPSGVGYPHIEYIKMTVHYHGQSLLPFYMAGAASIALTGTMPMFIPVTATGISSGNITLYAQTVDTSSGNIPLFIDTPPKPANQIHLYTKGSDGPGIDSLGISSGIITDNRDLFISGSVSIITSGDIPLYILGPATGDLTGNIPLYIKGEQQTFSQLNLYLANTYISNSKDLFIQGYWTVFGNDPRLRRSGGYNTSSSTHTFSITTTPILIEDDVGDAPDPIGVSISQGKPGPVMPFSQVFQSQKSHLFSSQSKPGSLPAVDNIPLYLTNVGASGSMILFMASGAALLTSNINLYTSGAVVSSGSMNLVTTAYEQITNQINFVAQGYIAGL